MLTLQASLEARSHRDLELIARAHTLPFSRRNPKGCGLADLSLALHVGAFQAAINRLTPSEIEALQALVAHGGVIDEYRFSQFFGQIRRYRSWRKSFGKTDDNPRHPWRYPASTAERLFQLGMIHRNAHQQIELIEEVAYALPPLPERILKQGHMHPQSTVTPRACLLRDLSVMLGIINRSEARALHGRWLSLEVMREVNLALSTQEDLSTSRSELQTGRLRWLHYLLQVSGLVCIEKGHFLPTALSWDWLDAPPQHRWDMLWHAVEHDLYQSPRLWDSFRFPEVDQFSVLVIRHLVDDCVVGESLRIKDILTMSRPYFLDSPIDELAWFMVQMLAWSGILTHQNGRLNIQAHHLSVSEDSQLLPFTWLNRELPIQLVPNPHAHALTRLLSFAQIEVGKGTSEGITIAYINLSAIRTACRQGYDCGAVIRILADITRQPVSDDVIHQLHHWFTEASRLVVKTMVILESDDPQQISKIHQDWRLRAFMTQKLSPNHIAVHAEQAHRFLHRLDGRNHAVTSYIPQAMPARITESLNPQMVDYLLLAVRTYQKLYDRHDNTVVIPSALTHWLEERASDPAKTEASVDALVSQLKGSISPQVALPDGLQDHKIIERLLRLAHHDQSPLSITYYSPYYDETSTRDILIKEIYESNNLIYLDSFCYRDNDQRTFRLDRIQRAQLAESDQERVDHAS